jgi:hypothetical protein
MAMTNELANLFQEAGDQPDKSTPGAILTVQPSNNLEILHRESTDKKVAWAGIFNFSSQPIEVPLKAQAHWRSGEGQPDSATIAPWTAFVVKCLPGAR